MKTKHLWIGVFFVILALSLCGQSDAQVGFYSQVNGNRGSATVKVGQSFDLEVVAQYGGVDSIHTSRFVVYYDSTLVDYVGYSGTIGPDVPSVDTWWQMVGPGDLGLPSVKGFVSGYWQDTGVSGEYLELGAPGSDEVVLGVYRFTPQNCGSFVFQMNALNARTICWDRADACPGDHTSYWGGVTEEVCHTYPGGGTHEYPVQLADLAVTVVGNCVSKAAAPSTWSAVKRLMQ